MKFKIGDKVRVKSFDEIKKGAFLVDGFECEFNYRDSCEMPRHILFVSDMFPCCEKVFIISEVSDDDTYLLKEDDEKFWWLESWLDPVTIEVINFDNIE